MFSDGGGGLAVTIFEISKYCCFYKFQFYKEISILIKYIFIYFCAVKYVIESVRQL